MNNTFFLKWFSLQNLSKKTLLTYQQYDSVQYEYTIVAHELPI